MLSIIELSLSLCIENDEERVSRSMNWSHASMFVMNGAGCSSDEMSWVSKSWGGDGGADGGAVLAFAMEDISSRASVAAAAVAAMALRFLAAISGSIRFFHLWYVRCAVLHLKQVSLSLV